MGVVGLSRPGLSGPFGTAVLSDPAADFGGMTFSIVAVSGRGGGTFFGMMRVGGSFFSIGMNGDTAGGPTGVVGVERCRRSRSDDTLSFFRASMRAWSIGGAGLRLPEGVLRCPMLLPESGVATPLVSVDWDWDNDNCLTAGWLSDSGSSAGLALSSFASSSLVCRFSSGFGVVDSADGTGSGLGTRRELVTIGGVLVVLLDAERIGREPSGRLRSDEPAALASELIDGVLDRHPAVTLGRLRLAESSELDRPSELRVLSTDGRRFDSSDGRSVVDSKVGCSLACATKAEFRARREDRRTGTWASCVLSTTGALSCVCAARACLAANAAPTPAMPATPPTPVPPVAWISLVGCNSGSARNSALSWLGTGGGAGIVGENTETGDTADRPPWLEPAELMDALRCSVRGTSGIGGEVAVDACFGELPG
jgi:hypothetical protein